MEERGTKVLICLFLLFVWVLWLLCIIILTYIFEGKNIWNTWEYDPGPWCERERINELIREPSNSYSDFSFLAVSLFMIGNGFVDLFTKQSEFQNYLKSSPFISIIGGFANFLHFLGTFWNHSCRCHKGHQLDVTGMLAVIAFNTFYLSYRLIRLRYKMINGVISQVIFGILFIGYIFILWPISDVYYNEDCIDKIEAPLVAFHVICTFIVLLIYTILYRNKTNQKYYLIVFAIGSLLAAFNVHYNDMAGINCNPDGIFQGHAIWHVATAFCLFFMYMFFRTERILYQYDITSSISSKKHYQ